jgi:NSS family neurotransmitter:Na+ symporter
MLCLEGSIGQRTKLPIVSAMNNVVGGKGRILGWFSILTCATIGGFYMVLTGFTIAYSYFSGAGTIPVESGHFFKEIFLKDTGSLIEWGSLAAGVFFSTLCVAAIAWMILVRNIQSGVEKICSIFLPLLGVLIVVFTAAVCFLPGAFQGFYNYLVPDFSRLADWTLWRDVFGQLFFSLSLGLGIVVGYSRHNPNSFNLSRAMVRVAIGDVLISILSGFAIFGAIGFMSVKSGLPFSEILTSDSAFEIGFVIFPQILHQFGPIFSRIIGPIFFGSIFIAGITGVFSIVEAVAGNIEVEFNKTRRMAVSMAMLLISLLALPFCMGNGQHLLGTLAPMVLGNAMLAGGIAEIIIFLMLSKVIRTDSIWGSEGKRSFKYNALKYCVLPVLILSLVGAMYQEFSSGVGVSEIVRYGWFALVLAVSAYFSSRSYQLVHHNIRKHLVVGE